MDINIGTKVERVNGKELTYGEFVEKYLERNLPVVLTGLMEGWRACKEWVEDNGIPNLHFMSENFGKSAVQVADCSNTEFQEQKRIKMSVSEFVNHWLEQMSSSSSGALNGNNDTNQLLYLKDWHFVKEYPQFVAYTIPTFFTDDWLNLYLDHYHMHGNVETTDDKYEVDCSDYRFVYMGAKGTWTPVHADVFRSYSWSSNVCGRKLWYFLPPSDCHLLFDSQLKNCVFDISADVPDKKFPGFKKTVWWECTQEKGEVIFVPSGWYHQVYNLEDTISINHNWFNGYNLSWVWNLLSRDYDEAREYIEDIREICDDFEGLCQRNLAANTGMNYLDFFTFLTRFSLANLLPLVHLRDHPKDSLSVTSTQIQGLVKNMTSTRNVALKMKPAEAFTTENLRRYSADGLGAFPGVIKVLEEDQFLQLCISVDMTYLQLGEECQTDSNTRRLPVCSTCGKAIHQWKEDFLNSYRDVVSGFDVFGPENLVILVDCIISDLSELICNANVNVSTELLDNGVLLV